jgi:hypothetical protein
VAAGAIREDEEQATVVVGERFEPVAIAVVPASKLMTFAPAGSSSARNVVGFAGWPSIVRPEFAPGTKCTRPLRTSNMPNCGGPNASLIPLPGAVPA